MGTRSLTFVYDGRKKVLCLYRQFDGYVSGHGKELSEFLMSGSLVNGIPAGKTNDRFFNGMGCLAAQLVANFKVGTGNFYLMATNTKDAWQDYEYHVYDKKVVVKESDGTVLFTGTWQAFSEFCDAEA